MVKVQITREYFDKEKDKYMKPNAVFEVEEARAKVLIAARVAEKVMDGTKEQKAKQ